MKKFKLFNEFSNVVIYGDTLADAVKHANIKTPGSFDRTSQAVIGSSVIEIAKILGYDDTNQSSRGGEKYESVIIETAQGKRLSIDATIIGDITPLSICPAAGNKEVRP